MPSRTLLDENKIISTIRKIRKHEFTVLDFGDKFADLFPRDWKWLVDRFGQFGEKRRYTISTYLSNRLDIYSHKPDSLLRPLVHYSEGKFIDRRRPTQKEKRRFGSPWITVFRKK